MNRTHTPLFFAFGTSSLLLMDSAIKGSVILLGAVGVAIMLKRDSAAMRHMVWLVAIVAMLVIPVLSVLLPRWQVLPVWAAISQGPPAIENSTRLVELPSPFEAARAGSPAQFDQRDFDSQPNITDTSIHTKALLKARLDATENSVGKDRAHSGSSWSWMSVLPILWSIGFSVLLVRLTAARWILWGNEQRATVVAVSGCPNDAQESMQDESDAAIATAFDNAYRQIGIHQRVQLLIDSERTIPVVWGIVWFRLMLPDSARQWSSEQLRSVLLHELAHIKRRDTVVQLLAQIACALHWFNPLVWFAAWRLHVERERACDDLVLAQGVRASAYAEHLLNVATKLSVERWTSACGLAMASHSPLESRLHAILSDRLNRRRVSTAIGMIGMLLGAGIAIPMAMLRAADDDWNPPHSAHFGSHEFSAYCVHNGEEATFVIAYEGDFDSTSRSSSNAKARTWIDSVTLTAKQPGIALSFHRTHIAPDKLSITTAPAEGRDLSKPAPPPREFGQKEYNLAKGRVFLLSDNGSVRQLELVTPVIRNKDSATKLATLIAKLPPQEPELDSADVLTASAPMHKDAKALYEVWQRHSRENGDIPGALVGELAAAVKQFIKYNPTWETVPTLNIILPRLDAAHDWNPADAIALLDEVAGIQHTVLEQATWNETRHTIRQGETLPKRYVNVPWGEEQSSGLRAAWVLEPSMAEYRIGTALKARLLVQNRGQVPVMLQVPTFHQGWVKGTDANGSEVQVSGIEWMTRALLETVRLEPGAYIEINTPGVGIGPRAGMGPWAGPRAGTNILANPSDELTLTYSLVPLDGSEVGVSEDDPQVSGPSWWLAHIKTRLNREHPLPADAAERTRLLNRAVHELFATAPTAEETEAFIADKTPEALDALANRLATRADVVSFSGKLSTAPVKFRVLAADPNADKQPRVVLGPGEYPLPGMTGDRGNATLKIVGRQIDDRRTNDAQLIFEATEFTGKLPPAPYKVDVPDGWGTWAIVCLPNDGFFYLLHKGTVRKFDYSAPRTVTDTPANDLPAAFRDEVKRQLDIQEISDAQQAEIFEKPAASAASQLSDWVLAWDFRISPLKQQYTKMRIYKDGKLETILREPPLLQTQLSPDELSELVALVAKNPHAKSQPVSKIAEYSKAISPTPELFDDLRKVTVRAEIVAVVHEGELFELDLNSTEAMVVDVQLKKLVGLAAIGGSEELSRLVELANRELMLKYPDLSTPIDPTDFYDGTVNHPAGKISVWFNYSINPESTDGQMVLLRISENGRPTIEPVVLPKMVKFDDFDNTNWKLPNITGDWADQLMTRGLIVEDIAPVAPAPDPRVESVVIGIGIDGQISVDQKEIPLEELKSMAATNAMKRFTIEANKEVPYAKVIAVIEALKASGVTDFSIAVERR